MNGRGRQGARRARWSLVALSSGLIITALASPAFAHNVVEERDPAPDSIVTLSPVTVSISTNDDFLDTGDSTRGFALVARDSEGLFYGDGCVEIVERTMSASLALGESGSYTVLYQFVSADGHTLQDSYTFTFEPSADHIPATGMTEAPVCGEEATEEPLDSGEAPPSDPQVIAPAIEQATIAESSVSIIPTVAGVIVLLIVLIGLGVSGIRKRRHTAS